MDRTGSLSEKFAEAGLIGLQFSSAALKGQISYLIIREYEVFCN